MKGAKNILGFLAFGIPFLFVISCAKLEINNATTNTNDKSLKLVYIISNNIKFYDFGILATSPELTLEIFKAGKSIGKFSIKNREICFLDQCAPKWPATKSFFGPVSYDNLFEDILLRNDIFEGIGKRILDKDTIIQNFTYGGEKIYYERNIEGTYFKNKTNGVTISIKDYKNE